MEDTVTKCLMKCALAAFIALVASCQGASVYRSALYSKTLTEAVKAGQDPMIVGCAWGFSQTGEAAVCAQAVSNQKR